MPSLRILFLACLLAVTGVLESGHLHPTASFDTCYSCQYSSDPGLPVPEIKPTVISISQTGPCCRFKEPTPELKRADYESRGPPLLT